MLQLLARLLVIGLNIISRIGIGCAADDFSKNKQLSMLNMLQEHYTKKKRNERQGVWSKYLIIHLTFGWAK